MGDRNWVGGPGLMQHVVAANGMNKSSLEAAAEAAARVNAMLIAKGKLKPSQLSQQASNTGKAKGSGQSASNLIVAEVEINDVPIGCRNMLTRGSTQDEVSKMSGAAVSTRGRYLTPDERQRNPSERPLYLCVQASSQVAVDTAVNRIKQIIANGMRPKNARLPGALPLRPPGPQPPQGPPVPTVTFDQPPPLMSLNTAPSTLLLQEKLFIGLEHAPPSFDVKGKLLGPAGTYLFHIQNETGVKTTLEGKGSGFIDPATGRECFEPMHIKIQHPSMVTLQQSKSLVQNLIQTVQQDYAQFQAMLAAMPPAVNPGTATLLAGLQQQSGVVFGQPGGTTLTVNAHPAGMPPGTIALTQQPQPGIVNTSIPSLLTTSVSPTTSFAQVLPTSQSLTFTQGQLSLAQAQAEALKSMAVSHQQPMVHTTIQPTISHVGLPPPQQPGLATLGSFGQPQGLSMPPPGQHHQPTALLSQPPGLLQHAPGSVVTSQPGTYTLIQQAGPPPQQQIIQSVPGQQVQTVFTNPPPFTSPPPASGAAPPAGHLPSVHVPVSGPPPSAAAGPAAQTYYQQYVHTSVNATASSASTSVADSTATLREGDRREGVKRRFTEEKDDKLPENLLGYQHGPPDRVNLLASAPPGHQNGEKDGQENRPDDRQLMPPPPAPPGDEPNKKKPKGALGNVAAYGNDQEDDTDVNSAMRRTQEEVAKYTFNQFSGKPQLYTQGQGPPMGEVDPGVPHLVGPPPTENGGPPPQMAPPGQDPGQYSQVPPPYDHGLPPPAQPYATSQPQQIHVQNGQIIQAGGQPVQQQAIAIQQPPPQQQLQYAQPGQQVQLPPGAPPPGAPPPHAHQADSFPPPHSHHQVSYTAMPPQSSSPHYVVANTAVTSQAGAPPLQHQHQLTHPPQSVSPQTLAQAHQPPPTSSPQYAQPMQPPPPPPESQSVAYASSQAGAPPPPPPPPPQQVQYGQPAPPPPPPPPQQMFGPPSGAQPPYGYHQYPPGPPPPFQQGPQMGGPGGPPMGPPMGGPPMGPPMGWGGPPF